MQVKIYYDSVLQQFRAFEAPEKPEFKGDYFLHYGPWKEYEKAYAEAKANALEVGNYGEIYTIVNDNLDREITLPCNEIDGVEYFDWKGSAVIKDGKYILSV